MSKPTLFFSHSSKDKDLIISIKDTLTKYTGGVLDIFMSSDGQSIPFGTNWIHKIEEGLNSAKIMFVFVTENSISSGWIYFEAGFAYSKEIHVIPVGIGVDIGALKAPLNLLQGFNITSAGSLNNFISIVNKEFEYSFSECFDENDYAEIIRLSVSNAFTAVFDELVSSISYKLFAEYVNGKTGKREHDIDKFFNRIIDYLDQNTIPYSFQDPYHSSGTKCIAVKGIKIVNQASYETKSVAGGTRNTGYIQVSISPYSFAESFELYRNLNMLLDENEAFYLHIRLNELYSYVVSEVDCAALVATVPAWFTFSKDHIGLYECDRLNLRFCIFNDNRHSSIREPDYVLSVPYDPQKTHASNIIELISQLYELKLIHKKTGEQNNA